MRPVGRDPSTDGAAVLDRLLDERPTFHFDQTHDWSLDGGSLRMLVGLVRPGWRVLETGCGYSTVVLAAAGCDLVTVAPSPHERRAIAAWCGDAGISLERTRWEEATSETTLPGLGLGPLDLVLIDGAHAFPIPFVDWLYGAGALRPGGIVVVDDVNLPAPGMLRDFLVTDRPRWRVHAEIGNCVMFRRIGDAPLVGPGDWQDQAWNPASRSTVTRVGAVAARARTILRIRSRLRARSRR